MTRVQSRILRQILRGYLVAVVGPLSILAVNARGQTYVFGEADFATGASPVALVSGDFNGDGKLDLATANSGDNTVSVLIGKPDGTFQPHVDYTVGASPSAITTGDFNGDGRPDLAVTNSTDGTVSILLGNGDGTFQVAGHYQTGSAPSSIVSGDFNGDGKIDLAVANSGSDSVSVLIGKGDGTFAAPVDYAVGNDPVSLVAGDFNADGKLDLAVANSGSGNLSVLIGVGDGTFSAPVNYAIGGASPSFAAGSLAVGDMNGDGKPDLVVASPTGEWGCPGPCESGATVFILLGNGDGTFAAAVGTPSLLYGNQPLALGDFNRDGFIDVALGGVEIFLGNGTAGLPSQSSPYSPCLTCYTIGTVSALLVGDFNGDGGLDLAGTVPDSNSVAVLLGDFDGTFQGKSAEAVGNHYYSFGPMAVVDGELVTTSACDSIGCGYPLWSGITIGGTFYNLVALPDTLEVGDFNADGTLDVAVRLYNISAEAWYLLVGNGDGTFQQPMSIPGPPSGTIFTPFFDFNGDGVADQIVLTNYYTVSIVLGGGPTLPAPALDFDTMTAYDVNGDGIADVVGYYQPGPVTPEFLTFLNLAAIAIYPNKLTFNLAAGEPASSQSVTISNPGLAPLKISSITATGDFTQTNNCISTFLSGTNCTITVTPIGTGPGTGSISIADNAPGSPHLVSLTATVPQPQASLTPGSLSFSDQPVSTASAIKTVTLTNSGNATLMITSIATSGDFAETNTCGNSVPAGSNCIFSVTFTPTASGTRTGTITITDNAPGTPQVVSLTGTGTEAPAMTLSASTMSVGDQDVSTTSTAHTLTLTNSGNGTLTIASITASGDFAETNTCGTSVAAGAGCTINITFRPTASGIRTGTITITDNAPGSPHVITLTGTGMGPAVSFSTSTMSVGGAIVGTTSGAHTVTLTNTGNMALTITGMTASPSSFSESNTCGSTLAAGASCAITVTFTPSSSGAISGMLSITDNAPGSPHQVTLSGTGQDFTIGPYNLTQSVPRGVTVLYDLRVAPEGGFSQTVSFACSGAPAQSTCSVTPASTTLDGRNPVVITMRVATQGAASVPPIAHGPMGRPASRRLRLPFGPPRGWPTALILSILLGGMLLMILRTMREKARENQHAASRARMRLPFWTPAAALLLLTIAWAACGGGGSSLFTPPSGGTPSGNYVITVTATSGHLNHAVAVQLTVQ